MVLIVFIGLSLKGTSPVIENRREASSCIKLPGSSKEIKLTVDSLRKIITAAATTDEQGGERKVTRV